MYVLPYRHNAGIPPGAHRYVPFVPLVYRRFFPKKQLCSEGLNNQKNTVTTRNNTSAYQLYRCGTSGTCQCAWFIPLVQFRFSVFRAGKKHTGIYRLHRLY
jgi:hypothetical protein